MTPTLYDTKARTKAPLAPEDPSRVRMYVCGPTVYDRIHVGNARPLIVFDLLFRLLRRAYGADHVVYARNLTDVDDKIQARAAARGIAIGALTAETTVAFHEDADALGCITPTVEPRATDHIAEMQEMAARLVERGHAYVVDGHVLFDIASMPDYGALSRLDRDALEHGRRVPVAGNKRSEGDFVLWKPSRDDEPGWDGPWGRGRPGWHIECSAMSRRHLGETFDIHGGGLDLVFPHHENEIAQSRCSHGTDHMARVWMHNGFVLVDGRKMSKSDGNFITVHDLLRTDGYGGRRWSGDAIRLAMLRTHYRQPIDWTARALDEADRTLHRWRAVAAGPGTGIVTPTEATLEPLLDDMNTPAMLSAVHRLFETDPAQAVAAVRFMGLLGVEDVVPDASNRAAAEALLARRLEARAARDWAGADRLRDGIAALGFAVLDAKGGVSTLAPL